VAAVTINSMEYITGIPILVLVVGAAGVLPLETVGPCRKIGPTDIRQKFMAAVDQAKLLLI